MLSLLLMMTMMMLLVNNMVIALCKPSSSDRITVEAGEHLGAAGVNSVSSLCSSTSCTFSVLVCNAPSVGRVTSSLVPVKRITRRLCVSYGSHDAGTPEH